MNFKVVDRSVAGRFEYAVLTECGKHVESFATSEAAQTRADWLEAEYERISEVL